MTYPRQWTIQSGFYAASVRLDRESVAQFLDVPPEDVDVAVNEGRLEPPIDPTRLTWSRDQVYRYILAYQPSLTRKIPRLYPFDPDIEPARFMFSHGVQVSAGRFAVHGWDPADDRGPIAMAYPTGEANVDHKAEAAAAELLEALPWASAVIVPTLGSCCAVTTVEGKQAWDQPVVKVAEPNRRVTDAGWYDVANLLRYDLPYWSAFLADYEGILAWQPSTAVQVLPVVDDYDGSAPATELRRLLTAASRPTLIDIVERAIANERRLSIFSLSDDSGTDGRPERPGLTHAARLPLPVPETVPLTRSEAAVLLHQPSPSGLTKMDRILSRLNYDLIIRRIRFAIRDSSPLAAEWYERLTPTDQFELGHLYLTDHAPEAHFTALRDPLWPDQWIVDTGDEILATIGKQIPAARGHLTELFVNDGDDIFFRGAGHVWPFPGRGDYRPGGGRFSRGSEALACAVQQLLIDSSADVTRPTYPLSTSSPLYRVITSTEPPLHLPIGHPALQPPSDPWAASA